MTTRDNPTVLESIVSKVLALGLTEFEVEYKDRHEHVFACNGPIGMGIAAYRAGSREAKQLRSELHKLRRKRQKITVNDIDYGLRVEVFDSFGEDAYRVTIQES